MLIRWTELSYPDLGAYRDQAAVMINFASTEQHSLHLPVGTDAFLGAAVTERAAELCHRPVLLLPQVCFGYSPHHRFAPGYVTMPQHLLKEYAVSICENVIANGFSQMFLVNSHGRNCAGADRRCGILDQGYQRDRGAGRCCRRWCDCGPVQ